MYIIGIYSNSPEWGFFKTFLFISFTFRIACEFDGIYRYIY